MCTGANGRHLTSAVTGNIYLPASKYKSDAPYPTGCRLSHSVCIATACKAVDILGNFTSLNKFHPPESARTLYKKCVLFCINVSESMVYNVIFGQKL